MITAMLTAKKRGTILLLLMIAAFVQSCKESTLYPDRTDNPTTNLPTVIIPDVYGVEWELEAFETWNNGSLAGESSVPNGQQYTLTFQQGNLAGKNDCNSYGVEYTLGANHAITTSNMISTLAECGPSSRDGDFAGTLERAVRYELNATTLRIFAESDATLNLNPNIVNALRFRRVKGPEIQLVRMELLDPAPSDSYSILSAQIIGDQLRLKVQYGGGCREHMFTLIGPLTIPAGDPTSIAAYLHHSANGDVCKALITRDLVFDLTPLRERWKNVTGKSSGIISLTLYDLVSGKIGPMTYSIGGGSGVPNWLQDTINAIRSRPVTSPGESIWQYTFNGATVYYRPPICCDIFSDLYDENGKLICHPDGGITASGDGSCPDFMQNRTAEKLIWKDPR